MNQFTSFKRDPFCAQSKEWSWRHVLISFEQGRIISSCDVCFVKNDAIFKEPCGLTNNVYLQQKIDYGIYFELEQIIIDKKSEKIRFHIWCYLSWFILDIFFDILKREIAIDVDLDNQLFE